MNKRMKELREKLKTLITDARSDLDSITKDTTEADAVVLNERHDAKMAEHDALQETYDREKRMDNAEALHAQGEDDAARAERDGKRPAQENREADASDNSDEPAPTVDEVFRHAIRFGVNGMSDEQRSVYAQHVAANALSAEQRAQSVGTNSEGGYTVAPGFLPEMTRSLLAWGPMLDPGVTREILTGKGNNLQWPTINDTAEKGTLTAENAASGVTGDDTVFGTKSLDAYIYRSGVVKIPTELLTDSDFNLEQLLGDLMGERLGRSSNTALTVGTGSSQPNGIVTAAAVGPTVASTTAITGDDVLDLVHSVNSAYRLSPKARFMFNDTTLKLLRKLKDGNSNYIWQGADLKTGVENQLLGYNYSINDDMASGAANARTMIFGDFNKYIVRKVGGFVVIVMRERYAEFLQTGFLAYNRIDGELADGAAVKTLKQAAV